MANKKKQTEDATNYTFLLQCMAALTVAAIATAAIITAVNIKLSAGAAAFAATPLMLTSSMTFAFLPVILVPIATITLICLLAYLFRGDNNTTSVNAINSTRNYSVAYGTSYTPTLFSSAPIVIKPMGGVSSIFNNLPEGSVIHQHHNNHSHNHGHNGTNIVIKPNGRTHEHKETRVPPSSIFSNVPSTPRVHIHGNNRGHNHNHAFTLNNL